MRPPPRRRSSNLRLVLLALIAGIGLGWLLRELTTPALSLAPPAEQPAASRAPLQATLLPFDPSPATGVTPTMPAVTPAVTATPALPATVGYTVHTVVAGDTLASIAAAGGSDPQLIADYNLLRGDPPAGRPLIIPLLAGRSSQFAAEAPLVMRGQPDRPWVALTLDAGAGSEPVPAILATLRERDVQITFFLTGRWVEDNPDLVRQIVADGHEIANHSYSHPDLRNLDADQITAELAATERLIQSVAGVSARPFFRPPYGAYDERVLRVLAEQGYLPIYWTLDSLDSVGAAKTPAFLLERTTATLAPEELHGAIILAHCGSAATAAALPDILDRYNELGLEVRKLSDVLGK